MAKQITWTNRAQQDRIEILHYWRIRNQSNTYSKKLNLLFKKAIALIAVHPHIGRRTTIEGIRVKLVRDYLISMKKQMIKCSFCQFGTTEGILKKYLIDNFFIRVS